MAESNVTIVDSYFTNGQALVGGAIYMLGESSVHIGRSKFVENVAELSGGAISAESFNSIKIFDNTQFSLNIARNQTGSCVYASSSLNFVSI